MVGKLSGVIVSFAALVRGAGCGGFSQSQRADQHQAGFVKLFDGKDFTGWEKRGDAVWVVEDGLLIGMQGSNNVSGGLIVIPKGIPGGNHSAGESRAVFRHAVPFGESIA